MRGTRALLVCVVLVACGGDESPTKAVGDLCYVASDCPDPLVCAFQKCRSQCLSDKDCQAKQHCVGATAPRTGVCIPNEDCELNSDCPDPLVCARNFLCNAQCRGDNDCLKAQYCDRGSCVDREAVPPDSGPQTPGKIGQSCLLNSDCEVGLACLSNLTCGKQCNETRDCLAGQVCVSGLCALPGTTTPDAGGGDAALPPTYGDPCTYSSDCAFPLICRTGGRCGWECNGNADCKITEVCSGGHLCIVPPPDAGSDAPIDTSDGATGKMCTSSSDCDDGVFCNGYERCIGGRCAPPLESPCDSHSSCVKDSCDEATKKCSHVEVTTIDADGDGHIAKACGGDDCNDKDATIYFGAPELCDLKDNDCDGAIDNQAVQIRGASTTTTLGSADRNDLLVTTLGTKFVVFTSNTTSVYAQTFTVDGTGSTESPIVTAKSQMKMFAIANSGDLAALLVDYGNAGDAAVARHLVLVKPDLSVVKDVMLSSPTSDTSYSDGGVSWNGTRFLAAWSRTASGYSGQYSTIEKDGTVTGGIRYLPTYGDAMLSGGPVQVAAVGTISLVGFRVLSTGWNLTTLGVSGDKLSDPVQLATPAIYTTPAATIATASNFVVMTQTASVDAYPITTAGVPGKPSSIAVYGGYQLDATSFGEAIAIGGRNSSDYTMRFAFSWKGLAGPWEYSGPFPVTPATTDVIRVGVMPGPQFGYFYLAAGGDKKLHYQRIGCAP